MKATNPASDLPLAVLTLWPLAGSFGGYAGVYMMAGPAAALSSAPIIGAGACCLLACQLVLRSLARRRVLYGVLLGIVLALSLAWFLLALVFPLIWMEQIAALAKALLLVATGMLWAWNGVRGYRQFDAAWTRCGDQARVHHSNADGTVDWQRVTDELHLELKAWVPGLGETGTGLASLALIAALLAGGSLRKALPVFSAWSMAIPCLMVAAFAMQLVGLGAAQVVRVRLLERGNGAVLRPGPSRHRVRKGAKRP